MSEFTLDADLSEVNNLVAKMLNRRKLDPLLQDIGRIVKADTKLNFRSQKDPDGKPWKPIQRDGQILSDSRRLRNSINYRVEGSSVRVGTNVEYARIHQFGFFGLEQVGAHTRLIKQAFGKKLKFPVYQTVGPHQRYMRIPARPFLGIGKRAQRKIENAIEAWAAELPE